MFYIHHIQHLDKNYDTHTKKKTAYGQERKQSIQVDLRTIQIITIREGISFSLIMTNIFKGLVKKVDNIHKHIISTDTLPKPYLSE